MSPDGRWRSSNEPVLDRQRVRQVGLVDLLREWLERVDRRDEERECGDDEQRRRARPRRADAQARGNAEQREAGEARRGEAEDAQPVAPPDRQASSDATQLDPRPHAGTVLRELASQHDHGPKVLHGHREAQLADEAGAPLGRLDRDAADRRAAPSARRPTRDHDREQVDPAAPAAATGPGCRRSSSVPGTISARSSAAHVMNARSEDRRRTADGAAIRPRTARSR